jgi:hypothetical protein
LLFISFPDSFQIVAGDKYTQSQEVNIMHIFKIIDLLSKLRLSTLAALKHDLKSKSISEATQAEITSDLTGSSVDPTEITAFLQALLADLPQILSLITTIISLFSA